MAEIPNTKVAARSQRKRSPSSIPSAAEILAVDSEYRTRAAAGRLHRIAPKKLNPEHEAWLPILHTHKGRRRYTALFSNTPRAHALGKTDDWVVIYYDGERGSGEAQCTVITAQRGPLAGHRIVRGRERECARFYAGEKGTRQETRLAG